MSKIYGYARVSTMGQMKDGNSLEYQKNKLKEAGVVEIIQEGYTGAKRERPLFSQLINKLEQGDTLIVTKLDRFARNTREGLEVIQELIDKGIILKILNMGTFDNTPQGRMSVTMFLAFAEFERDMIVQRTQEGKAIARTKAGFKEGRPLKYTKIQLNHAMELLKEYSYTKVEEMTRISKSTLTREARKRRNS